MTFMQELKTRIKSATPPFFKKIRIIGTTITSICTPIVAIPSTYTGAILPDTFVKICSYLIVAGVVMISVSSLAMVTPPTDNNS